MIPWKLREGSLRALQGWAAESELIKIHEWENNQQLAPPFTALSGKIDRWKSPTIAALWPIALFVYTRTKILSHYLDVQ